MMLHDLNAIFIHIPKTAGNTLSREVFTLYSRDRIVTAKHQDGVVRFGVFGEGGTERKHMTVSEYSLSVEAPGEVRLLAVFRDPLERLLSLYYSPNRWFRPKIMDRSAKYLSAFIGAHLEYSRESYTPVSPFFDTKSFKKLIDNTRSFKEFLEGFEVFGDVIMLDFSRLKRELSFALTDLGAREPNLTVDLLPVRNPGLPRHMQKRELELARDLVNSSHHADDYNFVHKIKELFPKSWYSTTQR